MFTSICCLQRNEIGHGTQCEGVCGGMMAGTCAHGTRCCGDQQRNSNDGVGLRAHAKGVRHATGEAEANDEFWRAALESMVWQRETHTQGPPQRPGQGQGGRLGHLPARQPAMPSQHQCDASGRRHDINNRSNIQGGVSTILDCRNGSSNGSNNGCTNRSTNGSSNVAPTTAATVAATATGMGIW